MAEIAPRRAPFPRPGRSWGSAEVTAELVRDLTSATERFAALLAAAPRLDAPAVGTWSVEETAAHVRSVAALNAHFASGARPAPGFRQLYERALSDTFSTHAPLTALGVEWAMRNGVGSLAGGLVEDAARLAVTLAETGGYEHVTWVGGARIPVTAVAAHMVSELLVHGFDIARSTRARFAVPDREARHFFETFVPAMIPAARESGFFDAPIDDVGPVAWRFRVRGGATLAYAFSGGELQVVEPATRAFDLTISARPASMLLVMYRRVGPAWPALRGQIAVWGRRPWRLGRVMRVLKTL